MIDITCQCGRSYRVALLPVHCRCGKRTGEGLPPTPSNPIYRGKCMHLGPIVGVADCDCKTKPSVYACGIHGICLPRMKITAALAILHDGTRATVSRSCQTCSEHLPSESIGITARREDG